MIEFYHEYVSSKERGEKMDPQQLVKRINNLHQGIKEQIERLITQRNKKIMVQNDKRTT